MESSQAYREGLEGRKALVAGAGASGVAAASLLALHGARVTLVDERRPGVPSGLEGVRPGAAGDVGGSEGWDFAVISPGFGPDSALLQALRGRGIPLMGEMEFGYRCSPWPLVAVTGTNGKTTTSRLVERMLRGAGIRTEAVGNIGRPLSCLVHQGPRLECAVLEASSFQLEHTGRFRPRVAVLLNLTQDHLDRHGGFAGYCRAKARIFRNLGEGDRAVVQKEALECLASQGIGLPDRPLTFSSRSAEADLHCLGGRIGGRLPGWEGTPLDRLPRSLRGAHNAENLMAALLVGSIMGIDPGAALASISRYRGEPHRMEVLPPVDGVVAINDSKSTNPDSLRAALEASARMVAPRGRLWLIAGGVGKGLSFGFLAPAVAAKVAGLYLYGRDAGALGRALEAREKTATMPDLDCAVNAAFRSAGPGDVVLFSPGCSSFDQFRDYADRGERFRSLALRRRARAGGHGGRRSGSPGSRCQS